MKQFKTAITIIVFITQISCSKNILSSKSSNVDDGFGTGSAGNEPILYSPPTLGFISAINYIGSIGNELIIEPTNLESVGSSITDCVSTPQLPVGLIINHSTCVISGIPINPVLQTYIVTATNLGGISNPAELTLMVCPSNKGEYIPIFSNPSIGTVDDFCVAKYEMKDVAGEAISQSSLTPWVNIGNETSKTECNALGTGYYLVNNEEWLTIAREIELRAENWSSGLVNIGSINRGHSDGTPGSVLQVTNINDPYVGTLNSITEPVGSGWEQKRTHQIQNGVIWDLAGNAAEWIDWQVTPANKSYVSIDGSPQNAWRDFASLDMNINPGSEMERTTWEAANPALNRTNGIGGYYAGTNTTGGTASRGAHLSNSIHSGIYSLTLNATSNSGRFNYSFRCVYRY